MNLEEKRMKDIEDEVKNNASLTDCNDLAERIIALENFVENEHKELRMRESYSKRLNLLIHGLEETESGVWETMAQTQEIYDNFMKQGLKLDPTTIPLVDIHRLPQQLVLRHGIKVHRPIKSN